MRTFESLAAEIGERARGRGGFVVTVDGRSGGGKTTFAKGLARALGAPLVHTDDVAWHHSFFDWWPLMIEHILVPFKQGKAVDWTPEAWIAKGRGGSITVPVSPMLIVEGVSASRRELLEHISFKVWIETDAAVAERRGLERDGPEGRDFWFVWQAAEDLFHAADKPWERADLIVDGAPEAPLKPDTEFAQLKPLESGA